MTGDIVNNGALVFGATWTNMTVSGAISGTGAVIMNGCATLFLSGNNTYTGGTTVNSGTLQIGNGGTVDSFPGDIVNYGRVAFDQSNALAYSGAITGGGSVAMRGSGTLRFTASGGYTLGSLEVSNGTLDLNGQNWSVSTLGGNGGTILNNGTGLPALTVAAGNYGASLADGTGALPGNAALVGMSVSAHTALVSAKLEGSGIASMPEPANLVLLGLGTMALLRRRR